MISRQVEKDAKTKDNKERNYFRLLQVAKDVEVKGLGGKYRYWKGKQLLSPVRLKKSHQKFYFG